MAASRNLIVVVALVIVVVVSTRSMTSSALPSQTCQQELMVLTACGHLLPPNAAARTQASLIFPHMKGRQPS